MMASMFQPSTLSRFVFISPDLTEAQLQDSPLAINSMKLLHLAEDQGGIALTKTTGAFNRKCVEWAAREFRWPGFEEEVLYAVNKVLNEPDFPPLSTLHWGLQETRLIRHFKGKAVLTKAGRAILDNHGKLQASLAEWILTPPHHDYLPRESFPMFWDLRHMLGVISNRLGDWVTLGEFTEWAIPVDLFPSVGPLGKRHEAALFIAYNLIRPLTWMGLLEQSERDIPALRMAERQIRKTDIFGKFFRVSLPTWGEAVSVH